MYVCVQLAMQLQLLHDGYTHVYDVLKALTTLRMGVHCPLHSALLVYSPHCAVLCHAAFLGSALALSSMRECMPHTLCIYYAESSV
jgi:hypothetical protein